jgi:hypothetical protein
MFISVFFFVFFVSCSQSPFESTGYQLNKTDAIENPELYKSSSNFRTHLTGSEEVPPVTTNAQGQAIFRLSSDGTSLYYKLIASNIEDVLMAHIHLAPAGQNGGIVVWLYPDAPPAQLIPGRHNGVLAEGTITDANLVGALAGMTVADLVAEIMNDNAYVNVHTTANMGGEIRGQIKSFSVFYLLLGNRG